MPSLFKGNGKHWPAEMLHSILLRYSTSMKPTVMVLPKLNINLRPGNYILTATDPETGLDRI